ncbi:hypothetical protein M378DRAFT_72661 [Amanita muscaria Koide BX008]|uniref:Uncharacterized protein n=1 Tax=Amanita muscaria (strain Koide BX008) TaxID=946122 RepID=A0A0C2XG39_AMAMK|nr:hypothetical protein M378DRAFT_72661 [Amanita muscaria Koide BX008]
MLPIRPLSFARHYASKYPRPRPGTAERPPMHRPDPLADNPNAVVTHLPDENLTFIHRPPPTAPSPFSLTTAPASPLLQSKPTPLTDATGAPVPLPPISRPRLNKASSPALERLSDEDVQKMRQLRRSDPQTYTRTKLADMFGCTQTFVGAVAALKKSQRKAVIRKEEEKMGTQRAGWSEKKVLVREIKAKRRLLW